MAFRWRKENIEASGGDHGHITIWDESAGAQSIGYLLKSYDGRNDDLYQSAIMESGSVVGTQAPGSCILYIPSGKSGTDDKLLYVVESAGLPSQFNVRQVIQCTSQSNLESSHRQRLPDSSSLSKQLNGSGEILAHPAADWSQLR
jgi:hypothetical protein